MEDIARKRPTPVTVIGWVFIIVAVLMILSGGMGLMVSNLMKQQMGNTTLPMPEHLISKVTMIVFENFELVASLQIVFAVFVLFAGIHFLKLHAWARTALEVVSWLGLVYVVGFCVLFVVSWMSMTSAASVAEGTHAPPAMFRVFGAFMVTVVMALWTVPLVVIIRFLRGAAIREATTQRG